MLVMQGKGSITWGFDFCGIFEEEKERSDLYCTNPRIQETGMGKGKVVYRQEKISEPTHRMDSQEAESDSPGMDRVFSSHEQLQGVSEVAVLYERTNPQSATLQEQEKGGRQV